MTIRKVWGSRVDQPVAETFVGKKGTLFFNEPGAGLTNGLRISDGVTPGGIPISLPPATTSTIGGIRPGPGVNISNSGLLTIDAAGLPISFGDFYANENNLSTVNANQDLNILSNGTGTVNIVGNLNVHPAELGGLAVEPIFRVKANGQIRMLVPGADEFEGAVEVIGSLDGVFQTPVNTGVMIHITGIAPQAGIGIPSRVYNDAQQAYSGWVARRYNGTALSPTKVLANEEIGRFVGNAYTGAGWRATGSARLSIYASENQEQGAQGGRIEMWACATGTSTQSLVASVEPKNGITSTKFTGQLIGNVIATTVTATNLIGALSPSSQLGITTVGTLTNLTVANTVTSNYFNGKLIGGVRNANTISDGGTLTVDFLQDSIVKCVWNNGLNLAYTNFTPGRIIKVIAKKGAGSGTDSINLDGADPAQTSSGQITISANQDTTVFIELISTTNDISGLFIKL